MKLEKNFSPIFAPKAIWGSRGLSCLVGLAGVTPDTYTAPYGDSPRGRGGYRCPEQIYRGGVRGPATA